MNLINRMCVLIALFLTTLLTLDPAYGQTESAEDSRGRTPELDRARNALHGAAAEVILDWKFGAAPKPIVVSAETSGKAAGAGAGGAHMDWDALAESQSREFVNRFQAKYAIRRQIHNISDVPVQTLLSLIEPELRTYCLVSKSKFTEATSEKWEDVRFDTKKVGRVIQEGRDYAITSPVGGAIIKEGDVWRSPAMEAEWIIQTRQESMQLLEGGRLLEVAGTIRLTSKVQRLLEPLRRLTEASHEQAEPISAYRLEVALLKGGKAGEIASVGQKGIGLSFSMDGTISRLPKVGAHVEQGEEVAALDTTLLDIEARGEGENEGELEAYRRMMVITAPVAGTIVSLDIKGLQVAPRQTIATLLPDGDSDDERAGVRYSRSVAKQYGISPEDVEMFGFDGFVELGKAVFWLSRSDGEERAEFILGDENECELQIQDIRPPYLVLSVELKGGKKDLETTVYLEEDKPSVVGITNMTEALLLVIRIREKR